MIKLFRENYNTYLNTAAGKPERHFLRLAVFALLSLAFALFASETESRVYSMMATGITVLTGFTFTALFSDHALASYGLPKPKDENDRLDQARLEVLSRNFSARSSYFITLAVLEVVLLAGASFDLVIPSAMRSWLHEAEWARALVFQPWFSIAKGLVSVLFVACALAINLIYLECLYTFYRMAESILAILDTRRTYLSAHDMSES
jgi:hypothetical protein